MPSSNAGSATIAGHIVDTGDFNDDRRKRWQTKGAMVVGDSMVVIVVTGWWIFKKRLEFV